VALTPSHGPLPALIVEASPGRGYVLWLIRLRFRAVRMGHGVSSPRFDSPVNAQRCLLRKRCRDYEPQSALPALSWSLTSTLGSTKASGTTRSVVPALMYTSVSKGTNVENARCGRRCSRSHLRSNRIGQRPVFPVSSTSDDHLTLSTTRGQGQQAHASLARGCKQHRCGARSCPTRTDSTARACSVDGPAVPARSRLPRRHRLYRSP